MLMTNVKLLDYSGYDIQMEINTSTQKYDISLVREFKKISDPLHENGAIDKRRYMIQCSQRKWTYHKYYVQEINDVKHTLVKNSCATKIVPCISFFGPYVKPHGVWGLIKHYHIWLDPELSHEKYAIHHIACECVACVNMLDKLCAPDLYHVQQ